MKAVMTQEGQKQVERQGIKVQAMPFVKPNAVLVSLTGTLALKDPKVVFCPLARICEKVAAMQRIDPATLREANTYALLGISEEGSVMALAWRSGAWLPTRAPVPSNLVRSKELGLARMDNVSPLRPVWVRASAQRLAVFKAGKEVVIWKAPALPAPKPEASQSKPKVQPPSVAPMAPSGQSKGALLVDGELPTKVNIPSSPDLIELS